VSAVVGAIHVLEAEHVGLEDLRRRRHAIRSWCRPGRTIRCWGSVAVGFRCLLLVGFVVLVGPGAVVVPVHVGGMVR
jgi:hypothetical protein